jgi:hypothetical protein
VYFERLQVKKQIFILVFLRKHFTISSSHTQCQGHRTKVNLYTENAVHLQFDDISLFCTSSAVNRAVM